MDSKNRGNYDFWKKFFQLIQLVSLILTRLHVSVTQKKTAVHVVKLYLTKKEL